MPVAVPDHLTDPLTISLWDFSWYTRAAEGEPFGDLDQAFAEAVARGYNCVRICAAPFLLFGSGIDTSAFTLTPLGGQYGLRTRWYDVRKPVTLDLRAHLLQLFRAAARHDCSVIVSSWEYQQSPCFAADEEWSRALFAIPAQRRPDALADALADLIDLLKAEGLADRVAFVELHNEVQIGRLQDAVPAGADPVLGLQSLLEKAIDRFHGRHSDVPVTANYARVPVESMRGIPRNADVAVFHPYVYGVLGELVDTFALRDDARPFPQQRAQVELLRPDAPDLEDWVLPDADRWRATATVMRHRELYVHDWCDPIKWDRWLYDRYGAHRLAMDAILTSWLDAAADTAARLAVPLVLGEGWVGYTPLYTNFEEGPVGAALCERAVTHACEVGAWGTVVCSNAAPQHPMWQDIELQSRLNQSFAARMRPRGAGG